MSCVASVAFLVANCSALKSRGYTWPNAFYPIVFSRMFKSSYSLIVMVRLAASEVTTVVLLRIASSFWSRFWLLNLRSECRRDALLPFMVLALAAYDSPIVEFNKSFVCSIYVNLFSTSPKILLICLVLEVTIPNELFSKIMLFLCSTCSIKAFDKGLTKNSSIPKRCWSSAFSSESSSWLKSTMKGL